MFKSACFFVALFAIFHGAAASTCTISPLGLGKDDTGQVLAAIGKCGKNGRTILQPGSYNITKKMTWNLENSQVDLHGVLNFVPDIQYWLEDRSTYRVVYIQDQASWFVVTGNDFIIDAHNEGGIEGNGQPWWEYFTNHTREDGDGRPLSLTLHEVDRGVVRNFHIQSPPFWCNAVANSRNVLYDGMTCNATNTNPDFFGQNIVPNTDGIDTYRSDSVTLRNWDVTCGDDCLAIKGVKLHKYRGARYNVPRRKRNSVWFARYFKPDILKNDIVENVLLEDLTILRINSSVQPDMFWGVYFKTWSATADGVPPVNGGGGGGFVKNVVARRVSLSSVDTPVGLYQSYNLSSGDVPSFLQFSDLSFEDWSGTASSNTLVNIACSPNAPCPNIAFQNFNIAPPNGTAPEIVCVNVISESGLPACNTTTSQ